MKNGSIDFSWPELHRPLLAAPGGAAGLGPYREELSALYWEWLQDPVVLVGYGRITPPHREEWEESFRRKTGNHRKQMMFTIYDLAGEQPAPVGSAGLLVNPPARSGELFMQIGVANARGRGVGSEAARLVLDYAFHVANLGCVHLTAREPNTAAIRAYEKAGFKRQGVRRNSCYWLGRRANQVLMDAIPEEFVGVSVVRTAVEGAA